MLPSTSIHVEYPRLGDYDGSQESWTSALTHSIEIAEIPDTTHQEEEQVTHSNSLLLSSDFRPRHLTNSLSAYSRTIHTNKALSPGKLTALVHLTQHTSLDNLLAPSIRIGIRRKSTSMLDLDTEPNNRNIRPFREGRSVSSEYFQMRRSVI